MKKTCLHLSHSPLTEMESSLLRQCKTLTESELFTRCIAIGLKTESYKSVSKPRRRTLYCRMRYSQGKGTSYSLLKGFNLIQWALRAFFYFRKREFAAVQCYTVISLPIGVALKAFKKCKVTLVYNPQELESQKINLHPLAKILFRWIEKVCLPFVDHTLVVSEGILDFYVKKFKGLTSNSVSVLRNIPDQEFSGLREKTEHPLRKKLIPSKDSLVFIYQGLFCRGRGIHLIERAFLDVTHRDVLFLGSGIYSHEIEEWAETRGNFHFHPAVSTNVLSRYTNGADIGLCLIEDVCLSYHYSLPNKLFEYLRSGLPVIVSPLPHLAKLIEENDLGWVVEPNPASLRKLIQEITLEAWQKKQDNVFEFRHQIDWRREKEVLVNCYLKALPPSKEGILPFDGHFLTSQL